MSASEHSHSEEDASSSLGVAFFLNLAFTILEVAGGIWTGSIAILSDALHDAGDCLSLGLAWYLQKLSRRGPDARFTYGYRRFSNLGALITGVVLMAGLCIIGWHAVQRLQQPREVNSEGMMAIAVAGIIFNGIAAWKLHGGHSLNQKMASWHLLEDVLGWIAVLIGSGIMTVWHLPIIDPLLSLGISIFILWNVFGNVRKVALVFLQSAPPGFDIENFDRQLLELPGVAGSHHTHTWTLDGEHHVFSAHLVVRSDSSRDSILSTQRRVHQMLRSHNFVHVTIEVELEGEEFPAE